MARTRLVLKTKDGIITSAKGSSAGKSPAVLEQIKKTYRKKKLPKKNIWDEFSEKIDETDLADTYQINMLVRQMFPFDKNEKLYSSRRISFRRYLNKMDDTKKKTYAPLLKKINDGIGIQRIFHINGINAEITKRAYKKRRIQPHRTDEISKVCQPLKKDINGRLYFVKLSSTGKQYRVYSDKKSIPPVLSI